MLYLRMYRAEIREDQAQTFDNLKARLAERLQPLLRPALEATAQVMGVTPEEIRASRANRPEFYERRRTALDGEVFADRGNLIVLGVHEKTGPRSLRLPYVASAGEGTPQSVYRLAVSAIGPEFEPDALSQTIAMTEEALGVKLSSFSYTSDRFDELKAEGREPPPEPSLAEKQASVVLRDRAVRALALAIKSSGGLLVRDLAKQLQPDDRSRVDSLTATLRNSGLIESEIVIVCNKSQAQVTRAPSREVLEHLSGKGLKCACGRPLAEEQVEEALAITDLGRSLLDKARWLTVLLIEALQELGISRDAVLVEQTVGGDEIDCLANISGELALFELKDKEFSLGNAYSFGAKIGITQPQHPVIITTERVGNDAKEHFRARLARGARDKLYVDPSGEHGFRAITYIEGVDDLTAGLQGLVSGIYGKDAADLLDGVVCLAALEGQALVRALEGTGRAGRGAEGVSP